MGEDEKEDALTLSKWPFYLGDGLLVAIALAIAFLGDWNLTNWQVLACVLAVALGAGLLVLPFVVEYYMRAGELRGDLEARLRVLHRRMDAFEAMNPLAAGEESMEKVDAIVRELRIKNGVLAEGLEQKISLVEKKMAESGTSMPVLEAAFESLRVNSERERVELSGRFDRFESGLAAMVQQVQALEKDAEPARAEAFERAEMPPTQEPELPPEPEASQSGRPKRATRKRRDPEAHLLKRAIRDSEDSATSAVNRIIGAKITQEPGSVETDGGTEMAKELAPSEENGVQAGSLPPSAGQELFGLPESLPRPKARAKKDDSKLTVNVLIGIGNKPYIRGGGAGLSWERGIEMDFEEIGKWSWIAPVELEAPMEVRVYRNDEDPDRKGRQVLQPGQKLEISPVF